MEPQRNTNATLVDLLDRVLDKGLIIHADVIVSVAGIPLIGVNLRAALAGMETMLKYGIMQSWDERTRAWEREHRSKKKSSLAQGEKIILKMLGSYYSDKGIYTTWRYGRFFLTGERLLLYHEDFGAVLFETPLVKIRGLVIRDEKYFTEKKERGELYLVLKGNKIVRLSALDVAQLKEAIEKRMNELGLVPEEDPAIPVFEESAAKFLTAGEEIVCSGKMWYLMDTEGIIDNTWRPGYLYLTDKRLCWWYDFEQKVAFEIPVGELVASAMEIRNLSGVLKQKKVLDIIYAGNGTRRVASFSGDSLEEWDQIFRRIITGRGAEVRGQRAEVGGQLSVVSG
ncbi:MAG: gas vesicle protein [Proteobacteria bacterium]|nr:gas vesicle protein [Pseudomonadota bacterium]MBU4258911.1 gas vesicle protein [Pseudomonadota bacterium]